MCIFCIFFLKRTSSIWMLIDEKSLILCVSVSQMGWRVGGHNGCVGDTEAGGWGTKCRWCEPSITDSLGMSRGGLFHPLRTVGLPATRCLVVCRQDQPLKNVAGMRGTEWVCCHVGNLETLFPPGISILFTKPPVISVKTKFMPFTAWNVNYIPFYCLRIYM